MSNQLKNEKPSDNNGWLSMPPNSQPENPTHGGTAATKRRLKNQPLIEISETKIKFRLFRLYL